MRKESRAPGPKVVGSQCYGSSTHLLLLRSTSHSPALSYPHQRSDLLDRLVFRCKFPLIAILARNLPHLDSPSVLPGQRDVLAVRAEGHTPDIVASGSDVLDILDLPATPFQSNDGNSIAGWRVVGELGQVGLFVKDLQLKPV
jgi:hypothetical protein